MITKKEMYRQLEVAESKKIFIHYQLEQMKPEINKGNDTIRVLYELLIQEVNKYNGVIIKKCNAIKDQGTID